MTVTLRPRSTVDMDAFLATALAYPGLSVAPSLEVDSLDTLPLLTWQCFNGRTLPNGPVGVAQQWTLNLSLFTADLVGGSGLADTVYQNVHDLEDAAPLAGTYLASVDDVSMFDRVGVTALPDKRIVQYGATFTVIAAHQ